jgi:hypothetical protein
MHGAPAFRQWLSALRLAPAAPQEREPLHLSERLNVFHGLAKGIP